MTDLADAAASAPKRASSEDKSLADMLSVRDGNDFRNWCSRGQARAILDDPRSARDRLISGEPVIVSNSPRFKFDPGASIYTIGSCFARNVERQLAKRGIRVPTRDIVVPPEWYSTATPSANTVLNKYNAHSMAAEILRGLDDDPPLELVEVWPGKFYDPQMSSLKFLPRADLLGLRQRLDALARELRTANAVLLTLGLTETWYNRETQVVLNGLNIQTTRKLKDKLAFFNANVSDVVAVVGNALERLREANAAVKIVITVSPVPMQQTFTAMDAITANTYSKATLRCACQELWERYDFVDYFPSFEMVTHSPRTITWGPDQIHVQPSLVDRVIETFVQRYTHEP